MGCGASAGPYPAEIPGSAALPAGIAVLDPKDGVAVQQAVDLVARAFAGSDTAPPPAEVGDRDYYDFTRSSARDRPGECVGEGVGGGRG